MTSCVGGQKTKIGEGRGEKTNGEEIVCWIENLVEHLLANGQRGDDAACSARLGNDEGAVTRDLDNSVACAATLVCDKIGEK